MSKVGRNEPCPCGSGKKFKKCCAHLRGSAPSGASSSSSSSVGGGAVSAEEVAYDPAMLSALMTLWRQRGLKDDSQARHTLWADRYRLPSSLPPSQPSSLGADASPSARSKGSVRAALEAMGEPHDGGVMLYHGQGPKREWEGEALFFDHREMLFVTPSGEAADRWRARFQDELGAVHLERRQEKLEAPSAADGSRSGGADLLAFKKTFFAQWPDEPNDKLGGVTPREASVHPALRPQLNALLNDLEFKERSLPKRERYDFQTLRRQLGLIP